MIQRKTKLRWRRQFKQRRQQVEGLGANAEQGLEEHVFTRFGRLARVWRFTLVWILLVVLSGVGTVLQIRAQSPYYQKLTPAPGGTYNEGIIGSFTSANPLYATSAADSSVSRLVFSGLMKYNAQNQLVPDLAASIKADASGKTYTVTIREDARWHDDSPVTVNDVAFTYAMIKNPDARSPMFNTWKDIKVTVNDENTVVFELPNALSTFPETLTNGLLPEHILGETEPSQLRTSTFNTIDPVGSGPFKWDNLEVSGATQATRQEVIGLVANEHFYRGAPKLNRFIIQTFRDEEQMVRAFRGGGLTAMVGLTNVPEDIRKESEFSEYTTPLTGAVMVFFKTSNPVLQDVEVRRSLVQSVHTKSVADSIGYPVRLVDSPLLSSHLGYSKKLSQLDYDLKKAENRLNKAGWKMQEDGYRYKGKQQLTFILYAQDTAEYKAVSQQLQKAWGTLGVRVELMLQNDQDIQGTVSRHDHEALLYGISIGPDPDVFAYWHSSQASPNAPARFNFSQYKSNRADEALEAGRTRSNKAVRIAKYQEFQQLWRSDAPALALYQPSLIYVTRGKVFNYEETSINDMTNRYASVEQWMIRQEKVLK